jgi:rhomboid protease GluP
MTEPTAGTPPAPQQPPPSNEVAEFLALLHRRAPRAYVVPALIFINGVIFALMVASGVSALSPTADSLVRWGANFGPRTLGGEPWRLLVSAFLHFGLVHVAMNLFVLYSSGPMVERLFGSGRFLVIYLGAAVAGSLASVAVHPMVASAGASGAVFGVYGALAGFLVRQRGAIPREVLQRLQRVAVTFVGYNLIFGFAVKGIDNAAHMGGLVGGALCGLLLARPLAEPGRGRVLAPAAVLAGALALAAVGVMVLPRPVDVWTVVSDFGRAEEVAIERYNQLIKNSSQGARPHELAEALDNEILPAWSAARQKLADQQARWPAKGRPYLDELIRFADARERAWRATVDLDRATTPQARQAATAALEDANETVSASSTSLKALKPF